MNKNNKQTKKRNFTIILTIAWCMRTIPIVLFFYYSSWNVECKEHFLLKINKKHKFRQYTTIYSLSFRRKWPATSTMKHEKINYKYKIILHQKEIYRIHKFLARNSHCSQLFFCCILEPIIGKYYGCRQK